AESFLKDKDGVTLVVCGDTPLITSETYESLIAHHTEVGAEATILSAKAPKPDGYGRIVRNEAGDVARIVEHKDAKPDELKIDEINTGTYCFDNKALFEALKKV